MKNLDKVNKAICDQFETRSKMIDAHARVLLGQGDRYSPGNWFKGFATNKYQSNISWDIAGDMLAIATQILSEGV